MPFDKLGIGFDCAVREPVVVAERPRFTGIGGGGITDDVDVDRRGRREGTAEEVEDSALLTSCSEEPVFTTAS